MNDKLISQLRRAAYEFNNNLNARAANRIEQLEAALRKIADIEHEDLPKPSGTAEGTLWAILAGCVEVAEAALEGKDD